MTLDHELERRDAAGTPVRLGLVGAGYIARGIAIHAARTAGVRLVAVASRTPARAHDLLAGGGAAPVEAATPEELDAAVDAGRTAVAADPSVLTRAQAVDVVLEATGDVGAGARVALAAIEGGKHVVLLNAGVDATVGPLLEARADAAGVTVTNTDGDEPGVAMGLIRHLRAIGLTPVAAGNLKGLLDRRRTPDTQRAFAAAVGQDPKKVTSYADGTKLAFELTILANAAGFGVACRGMNGYRCAHVDELAELWFEHPHAEGMVDYCLGAAPGSGVFVLCRLDDAAGRVYLEQLKLGRGPLYVFSTPWHLPHAEACLTAARAALFGEAAVAPLGAPRCETFAAAKRDLGPGDVLDGIGGFDCYGVIDNAEAVDAEGLLPMGVAEGCTVVRPVRADAPVAYADVELPADRLIDRLRDEQRALFAGPTAHP